MLIGSSNQQLIVCGAADTSQLMTNNPNVAQESHYIHKRQQSKNQQLEKGQNPFQQVFTDCDVVTNKHRRPSCGTPQRTGCELLRPSLIPSRWARVNAAVR